MKSKFLIFSLLLLVFVVGIGAISAEDASDMGEISSDEVTDEVISVDDTVTDVSTSDADEVVSDGEPTRGTYTWGDFKSEVEDTNVNTVKLNQSNIAPSSSSSDEHNLLNDIDNYNHVYVSPDGSDDGSSPNAPGNFIDIIYEVDEGTVIHMLDGIYTLNAGDELYPEDLNNVMIIADNPGKVTIDSQIYPTGKFTETSVFYFTNCDLKFENIIFSSTLVENQGNYNHIWGYFVFEEGNYIFEDCKFINTYSACLMYLTEDFDNKVKINNCSFINNNILNDDSDEILGLIRICSGDLTLENIICDKSYNIYYPFEDSGVFSSHATLTFLNGEESVTVGENSNLIINASLTDDYGNIIILPNIKCTIFGQERTLSYSDGVYQTTITTPDILDTYNIDGVDDFIDTYLSDCTIIIPDIVVGHSHNVTLNTSDISYGENATVNITVSSVESGNISYTVKSGNNIIKEEVNKEFSNNSASIVLDNLDAGTYTVTVTVLATEEYGETTVSRTFTVNRVTPNISVIVNNVTTLDNVTVNVTVPEGVTGQILIQIGEVYAGGAANRIVDDKTVQVKSGDSVIITYAPFAAKDTYALGWSFTSNNTNYNSVSNNNWNTGEGRSKLIKFEVVKADSNLTIKADDIDWGNDVFVSITIDSRFTGNITVKLGDDEKIAEIKDGSGNVSFANLKADTYNVTAKFNETDLFTASQKDINVTVNKVNSTLTLDNIVFDWNKTGSTTVSYSGATNVEAVIVETGTSIPIQGNTITVSNLKAGNYTLRVTTVADENHTGVTKDVNIKVNKVNSTLTLGDDIVFDWNKSGTTSVSYAGATDISASVDGGVVSVDGNIITVSGLSAGNHTLSVSTVADENHTSITRTVNVRVNKVNSTLTLGDDIVFDWNKSGTTNVVSYAGAINISASVDGGVVSVDGNTIAVSGLSAGNHTLSVSTVADENHTSITKTVSVKVNKVNATVNLNDIAFDYGSFNSTTFDGEGIKNVTATILNQPDAKIDVSANTITVSGLDAGNYTLEVIVVPDENHNTVTKTVNVTVNKIDSTVDIRNNAVVYDYGDIGYCSIFTEGAVDFAVVIVDHPEAIIKIDERDIANITGLNAGNYTLKVTTTPDRNHKSVSKTVNVTVNKVDSKLTIPDITFTYGESATVSAVIGNASGIAGVSVVGHPEANVTVNGTNITVSGLNAGTYILTASTVGDVNYNPVSANATVTVKGVDVPASQALSTNVPANSQSPTFSIKLDNDATGNFTVSVDGKVVDTKPLKDGSASITVANLAAGNHKISISYSGDGKYAPIAQNTTLTIKAPAVVKNATQIVAKKKTFKAKVKVKKYTITLKSGKTLLKKVKVTLKVKGKTYKATTNNKGKATFNIKNLKKKGTYNAVIKFKGNKNYKATSKKVKIKVKK